MNRSLAIRQFALASAAIAAMSATVPAQAAPFIITVNQDLSTQPFTFSFLGGSFTFGAGSGFASYLAVKTAGTAAVRTVFGSPSTDFTNRGTVVYDMNTLGGFGKVKDLTSIPYTNGENFLGLRVTSAGKDYYGYAFSTDTVLNRIGFETLANTGITAITGDPAAAVPEPAGWALMITGFGAIGYAMRRRTSLANVTLRYA